MSTAQRKAALQEIRNFFGKEGYEMLQRRALRKRKKALENSQENERNKELEKKSDGLGDSQQLITQQYDKWEEQINTKTNEMDKQALSQSQHLHDTVKEEDNDRFDSKQKKSLDNHKEQHHPQPFISPESDPIPEETMKRLPFMPESNWLNMNIVETDKLQWLMGDLDEDSQKGDSQVCKYISVMGT